MGDDIAIQVDNVSKTFKLPHEKQSSLKGLIVNFHHRKKTYEKQEALQNISFNVKRGEFFGIVGRNGSGKSTLLKLLAGIYEPDQGAVRVNGKLTPFIELGVGFNPELTGRENVYLNGALLGFNRKEMNAMYEEIVDFAELRKFMDQKLKNYSSGMQVRLAFSIAIRAKSDILLIDEVLAVGDSAFQQKCFEIFEEFKKDKRTIVFVSHDMENIERFCDRALMIGQGKIIQIGEPRKIAYAYQEENLQSVTTITDQNNTKQKKSRSFNIELRDENDKKKTRFSYDENLFIALSWPKDLVVNNIGFAIYKNSGENVFGVNTMADNFKYPTTTEGAKIKVRLNLGPGKYGIAAGLFGKDRRDIVSFEPQGPEFIIEGHKLKNGQQETWDGTTFLDHEWDTLNIKKHKA